MPEEGILNNHIDTQGAGEPTTPVGESQHDQDMIAKADEGLNLDANNTGTSDQLLAGKYKDEAALNKGVTELLKMQYPDMSVEDIYKGIETGKLVPSSTATDASNADVDKGTISDNIDDSKSELNSLDPVALTLERSENDGQLTPETREKIIKEYNIPEDTLDTYLAGLTALEGQFVGEVYELTGGEQNYNSMLTWMNDNLADGELEVFNDQLATQDIAKVKLAVDGMNARFKAVVGDNPDLIRPNAGDSGNMNQGGYASKAEWLEDMAKPEYKTSQVFRDRVLQKMAKSPNI